MNLTEPTAKLTLTGQYKNDDRRMLLKRAELNTPTLVVNAADVIFGMPEDKPMELAGTLNYRGDLARLRQWTADPATPVAWHVAGQISGEGRLKQVAGVTTGRIDTQVRDLLLQSTSGQQFREPQIQLLALGDYDHPSRVLKLEQFKLTSDALRGETKGQVTAVGARPDAQLAGQLHYDLEKVSTLLRSYMGDGVYLAGNGSRPLSIRGPMTLAEAQADAGVNWSGAYLYGFGVGPGELKMRLAEGMLRVDPLDLAVSQGRVQLAPRMRLAPGPMELEVDPGRVAEQIRINPDMCAQGLQYIAPILAGVATAEGTFSVELDGCRIPLDDPARGDLAGRFTVHIGRSRRGAVGPRVGRPAAKGHAGQAHEGVGHPVPHGRRSRVSPGARTGLSELTIRTHGSVGLDQSLAMVAEMPIPPKWLVGNTTINEALRVRPSSCPSAARSAGRKSTNVNWPPIINSSYKRRPAA